MPHFPCIQIVNSSLTKGSPGNKAKEGAEEREGGNLSLVVNRPVFFSGGISSEDEVYLLSEHSPLSLLFILFILQPFKYFK